MMMVVLCIFSREAKSGAAKGLHICATGLIPSLFPFLVAGQLLAGAAGKAKIATPLCRFLKLTPAEYTCFWLSQVGGYPLGAYLLAAGVKNNTIDKARAAKLVPYFVGCGPGFALGAVNKSAGFAVYLCCIAANLLAVKLAKLPPCKIIKGLQHCSDPVDSVQQGSFAMMNICANVVVFCTVKEILGRIAPLFSPLWAFLEVGGGVFELAQFGAPLPLFGALLGFGGFAVVRQVAMASGGLCGMGRILALRGVLGICVGTLVWALQQILPQKALSCNAPVVQALSPGVNVWCAASLALFFISAGVSLLSPLQADKTLVK